MTRHLYSKLLSDNVFLWDSMWSKNPILRRNKSILCLSAIALLAVRNVITNSCPVFYISVFTHSIYMQTKLGWLFSGVSLYTIRSGRQLFHILHIIITKVILDCFDTNENFIWLVTSYTISTGFWFREVVLNKIVKLNPDKYQLFCLKCNLKRNGCLQYNCRISYVLARVDLPFKNRFSKLQNSDISRCGVWE